MRRNFVYPSILAGTALLFCLLAGCNQGSPGGPGATSAVKNDEKSQVVQADDSFNLSAPLLPTTIKQGERISSTIGIKRGVNFDGDVSLKFDNLPTGVKIEPSSPKIKHGDAEANVTLVATQDASLGDFTILVVGHPSKGSDADVAFKLTVATR
jgi:hypothetical protein